MARISSGVSGLQQANASSGCVRTGYAGAGRQTAGEQSSMLGLMSSLADGVGMSINIRCSLLVLSCLPWIDVWCLFSSA